MGGCPNNGVNVAAGTSGLTVAVEMPNYHSELSGEKNKIKVSEDLSNGKNMVFNVKKLLNINLTLRRRGEKEQPG
jgi:hypothetical protein